MIIDRLLKRGARRIIDKVVEEVDRRLTVRLSEHADRIVERVGYHIELEKTLASAAGRSPHELFKDAGDDYWLWLNTEGCRASPELRGILPSLPPESSQLAVSSLTGDATLGQAFSVYTLFRTLIERHHSPLATCEAVLDFGCGWGRVSRFFLKDLTPAKLWGIESWKEQVEQAKRTNRWSNFVCVDKSPPTPLSAATFDVVFSYSVFSHLPEALHERWVAEFHRILRPGGLVIATTWGRNHIEFLERVKAGGARSWHDHYNRKIAERFPGRDVVLSAYDRGGFCHVDLDYAGYEDYGETMIPKAYVLQHWTRWFEFVDYIDDRQRCAQNVIVMRKAT